MSFKPISLFLSIIALWTAVIAQAQVTPSVTTLGPAQQQQFSLAEQVTGWEVLPAGAGTITSAGLYTAPAVYTSSYAYVYGSSGNSYYAATVNLSPTPVASAGPANSGVQVSISVSPSSAYVVAGQSAQFTASVTGTTNQQVMWSITQGTGFISSGLYYAPASVSAPTAVTITAASVAEPSKTASATVVVEPLAPAPSAPTVSVSLTPQTVSLTAGQTKQFTATVSGTINTGIYWSISPNIGSVAYGLYTAPASITSAQSVTITATSAENGTATASATINLGTSPAAPAPTVVSVGLAPTSTSLSAGQSQKFTASVTGTTNTGVTWSLVPNVGTIVGGLYTAPATISAEQTITVLATSVANTAKVASAAVQLQPASPVGSSGSTFTPLHVRSGGGQYIDSQGVVWAADYGYSGTESAYSMTHAIGGTASQPLYQEERYGQTFQYNFSVPNGTYSVTLKFAEIYFKSAGARVFNVVINNQTVLTNFDIFAQAGGEYQALDKTFTVPVSNGQITIQFAASVNNGKVDAIQISQQSSQSASTPAVVGVSLSPSNVTLSGGDASTQFTATVTGSSDTAVTWSFSPSVGSIVGGLYTAPETISATQSITITATSAADPTKSASATVNLQAPAATPPVVLPTSVSPSTATVAPSGIQQFSVQNLPAGASATWTVSPPTGSINATGFYTAPSSVAAQTTVTVTATNASTLAVLGTASLTLQASPAPAVTGIVLPVEVMGANSATKSVSFAIPPGSNLSGQLQLWLQIHGLEYQSQASVQVNGGAWIPINDTTATYLGHSRTFGGIGGGFTTLQLTLNLPAGSIQTGQNTLTFSFNGTNGISSGFRVLNLNVLAAGGGQLIPAATFTQDDPTTWAPPLNDAADIQAGQALWQTANLTTPGTGAIQAKCGNCHSQDGRDLKYFNYSNFAIEARSMFHGLTAQQGAQIASYIRTLNAPASSYGAPWNPPYQPGPGTDSRAVSDWAAGAGLSAVLDLDADTLPYVMPGGSTANLAANGFMNQREIPIDLQLRDWNHWLPTVYPLDAFGSQFSNSGMVSGYLQLRAELVPNDPTSYSQHHLDITNWYETSPNLENLVVQPQSSSAWSNPVYDRQIYSIAQWMMVKTWEINQEYGLEGMPQAAFGPKAENRAWYSNLPFFTSPFMLKIPHTNSPGIGNGSSIAFIYDSFIWYQTQLILNDGNGLAQGTWPIDWGYATSYLTDDLTWNSVTSQVRVGTAGLFVEWAAKQAQAGDNNINPYSLVGYPAQVSTWSEITTTQKIQIFNAYLQAWLNELQPMTPQQFFAWNGASPVFSYVAPGSASGELAYSLPQLLYAGADPTLLDQVAAWGAKVWPAYNWTADLNTSCTLNNVGAVVCP
jgi:hypothetical protein